MGSGDSPNSRCSGGPAGNINLSPRIAPKSLAGRRKILWKPLHSYVPVPPHMHTFAYIHADSLATQSPQPTSLNQQAEPGKFLDGLPSPSLQPPLQFLVPCTPAVPPYLLFVMSNALFWERVGDTDSCLACPSTRQQCLQVGSPH